MPTVSESRTIAASPEEIWAALADIENAGRWNSAWRRIEITSSQREGAGTTFRAHTEDGSAFEFRITHWVPGEYIAFAPVVQEGSQRYLIRLDSQAFLLRPLAEDQTHVELIAAASSHGLRGWLLARFFWPGYQKHGLRRALDALQALFEPTEDDGEEPPHQPASG